jgi:LPS sulfotransferase NodH
VKGYNACAVGASHPCSVVRDGARRVVGRQAQIYLRGLLSSHKHDSRFVIYCRGRDGSTLLVDLLNQLPEVHCDDEILFAPVRAPRLYVRGCESIAPGKSYGFKLLFHHLTDIQRVSSPAEFLRHLDRSGYKIIHLRREDLPRQVLSNLYVHHRGGYASGSHHHRSSDGRPEVTRMSVNIEELESWLRETERIARDHEASLSGLSSLDLVYERDLQRAEDHQGAIDRVADYLDVRPVRVKAGLVRLTTDDLAEFVSNYDEVVRFIEQTEYRRFLSAS